MGKYRDFTELKQVNPLARDFSNLPDSWFTLHDFYLRGVRKRKKIEPYSNYFIRLTQQNTPPPPEARITTLDTFAEVYSITRRRSEVRARLEEMITAYRRQLASRKITASQLSACINELNLIGLEYTLTVEETANWFLENFFRIYEDKLPDDEGVEEE